MTVQHFAPNGERRLARLASLADIGRTETGACCRLALTDDDKRGHDQVVAWMRERKLEMSIDPIGNIFGVRTGRRPDLAPVMTGSHIDTVRTGGAYDGNLGVLAGLEVVATLNDAGYAASAIAHFVRGLTREMGGNQVTTVGKIDLVPNLINVIAARATLTVDLRNTDEALLQQAERLGLSNRRMTSGAGHDAQMLARLPDRDDLRPQRRRHQPQSGRTHRAGRPHRRCDSAAAHPARTHQPGNLTPWPASSLWARPSMTTSPIFTTSW